MAHIRSCLQRLLLPFLLYMAGSGSSDMGAQITYMVHAQLSQNLLYFYTDLQGPLAQEEFLNLAMPPCRTERPHLHELAAVTKWNNLFSTPRAPHTWGTSIPRALNVTFQARV